MVKRSPTLGTLVSTKTKCIKLKFIGKITLVPVAFLMALSIYLGSLEIILRTLASGMTFRLPVITCRAEGYKYFRILTISRVGSIGIYIYISNHFIKVKYSRPYWFCYIYNK